MTHLRSEDRKVEITPPGDVRPAFEHDIEHIRSVVDKQFGEGTGYSHIRQNFLNMYPPSMKSGMSAQIPSDIGTEYFSASDMSPAVLEQ